MNNRKITVALFALFMAAIIMSSLTAGEAQFSPPTYGGTVQQAFDEVGPQIYFLKPEAQKFRLTNGVPNYEAINPTLENLTVNLRVYTLLRDSIGYYPELHRVYCKPSWKNEYIEIYRNPVEHNYGPMMSFNRSDVDKIDLNLTLTQIPLGTQFIQFTAVREAIYWGFGEPQYYRYTVGGSSILYFTVESPLTIVQLSPENKTHNSNDVLLTLSVDKIVSWIGYSLDNSANVTVAGNTTLTKLSNGSHSLILYANDTAGNMGKSEIVFFTVDLPEPTLNPSPSPTLEPTLEPTQPPATTNDDNQILDLTAILVLSGIVVVAVAVGSLVIFRRRR